MDIKVLRYFLALAREESITAAAQYLHLTQPTLSRQLSELEQELGKTLFIRGSRKITLTEDGIRLRKRAEEILELVKKTKQEFQTSAELISGNIFIGCGETHAVELIAQVIKDLHSEHPNINIHIYSGDADEVTEQIDKGLLDFGLLIGADNISKYDSLLLPAKDTWGVLMRKDSPLATKDTISPQDLWDLPLIFSKQKEVDKRLTHWLKRDLEKLNVIATYNLIYNASLMVEKNIGYALSLDKLINTTGDSLLCFKPLSPPLTVDINLVCKRYQVFSKAAELFLQRIKQVFTHIDDA
ncbi:LysR family transcriptional regulator [Orbus wheelerorum]|uniref:LysR family transcriptional regulator n=1 Tax=Orbus wheelerorum TaxID=3074111 RepID=UPI00370D0AC4